MQLSAFQRKSVRFNLLDLLQKCIRKLQCQSIYVEEKLFSRLRSESA